MLLNVIFEIFIAVLVVYTLRNLLYRFFAVLSKDEYVKRSHRKNKNKKDDK